MKIQVSNVGSHASFSDSDLLQGTSNKPQYREIVSQLPQMGNFRHQPMRAADRERDNTERDLRFVRYSGMLHIRLLFTLMCQLSDKFDREKNRFVMSSNTIVCR